MVIYLINTGKEGKFMAENIHWAKKSLFATKLGWIRFGALFLLVVAAATARIAERNIFSHVAAIFPPSARQPWAWFHLWSMTPPRKGGVDQNPSRVSRVQLHKDAILLYSLHLHSVWPLLLYAFSPQIRPFNSGYPIYVSVLRFSPSLYEFLPTPSLLFKSREPENPAGSWVRNYY